MVTLVTIGGDIVLMSGKITACDTANVTVASSVLPTGASSEVTLSSLDGKLSQGYDSQVASGGSGLQQVLLYGRDSGGDLDALCVSTSGHLKTTKQISRSDVEINDDFSGSDMLGSISNSTNTAYWDSQSYDYWYLYLKTSSTTGSLILQGSHTTSAADFGDITELFIGSVDSSSYQIKHYQDKSHLRYWRLRNTSWGLITFSDIRVHFLIYIIIIIVSKL